VSLALLTALGWFPMWGKLRRAETRVANGGPLVENAATGPAEDVPSDWSRARPLYFFLPLLVLIAATLWLDKDALLGVMAGLVFTFGLYWLLGVMRPAAAMDGIFEGFKSMIFALAILTMSYVLKKVGDEMGLTRYVIDSVSPWLSKAWLAPVVFLALAFISYTTASSWGMYAVAIPIVAPLAQATGANVWLALAAVVSAGAFGSQASFFSDVTVLTATSTECNNVELSTAQLPYSLLAVAVAAGLFLVCGWAI
jgi:Na+/H+ antiporter NhaC